MTVFSSRDQRADKGLNHQQPSKLRLEGEKLGQL